MKVPSSVIMYVGICQQLLADAVSPFLFYYEVYFLPVGCIEILSVNYLQNAVL
jgi:hypothetical protein